MLIMKMLSQKAFQFIYYFFFVLFNCLFVFIAINRTYFWKAWHLWYQLIPGFPPQKEKKYFFFGKWDSHHYRKNQGRLSVSVIVWRSLCQKVVFPSSIRPRSFLPEINSSNKEIKKAVAFLRKVHLLVISWKCCFRTYFFFTNLCYCSINLQLNWKEFSKNFCSPW